MKARTVSDNCSSSSRWTWQRLRHAVLAMAFLVLIITPVLNYFWGITFIQGWYQSFGVGDLRIISPLEGLESQLVSRHFSFAVLVGMLIPLLAAMILGRVFCSWVCPISFLAEMLHDVRQHITGEKQLRDRLLLAKRVLWFALIGELVVSLVLGAPVFVFLSPPGLIGREFMSAFYFHRLAWEGVVVLVILCLELVTRRFYCRYFCPLGALLALMGKKRQLIVTLQEQQCTNCGRCRRVCPQGLEPHLGEAQGVYCWNCGACIDSCREKALQFSWRSATLKPLSQK